MIGIGRIVGSANKLGKVGTPNCSLLAMNFHTGLDVRFVSLSMLCTTWTGTVLSKILCR